MNIPVNELKSWLGEPYGIEEGIDSDALVYRKEATLSISVSLMVL